MACSGAALARAALAGNPSDGYGGATLAVTLPVWRAEAQASPSAGAGEVVPPSPLVQAAVSRFARELAPHARATLVSWHTDVPRSVGLGGSSAIVIATLRALCELHETELAPADLARLALAIEVEELGIAAGLQDRVAQSFGGLTFMDFEPQPRGHGAYEALQPSLLPPLLIAYRSDTGSDSGGVHGDLRVRYERGDQLVRDGMAELAGLARNSKVALLKGDTDAFGRCVDGSFDIRRRMLDLDPRHVEMIERARAAGASANYTGSGGAIVCVCRDEHHRDAVSTALCALGCTTVIGR
jgi:glucuronokinase